MRGRSSQDRAASSEGRGDGVVRRSAESREDVRLPFIDAACEFFATDTIRVAAFQDPSCIDHGPCTLLLGGHGDNTHSNTVSVKADVDR